MELTQEMIGRIVATLVSFRREKRWIYGIAIGLTVLNYYTRASSWYVILALWLGSLGYIFLRRRFISNVIERETGLDHGQQYNVWLSYLRSDVIANQEELERLRRSK